MKINLKEIHVMPKIDAGTKEQIKLLSKSDLQKIVIKLISMDKIAFDYLLINYLDKETGENELFEDAKNDLESLFCKSYRGFSEELQLANMISTCIKRINEFAKICKKKDLEADLLMHLLKEIFSLPDALFGTCFTAFDYKTGLAVKRVITLINTKLDADFKIEYAAEINKYLTILHSKSNHLDFIYNLPQSI